MSSSPTNERIKQIVARKKKQAEFERQQSEAVKNAAAEEEERVAGRRQKWTSDVAVIADATKGIERQFAELQVQITFSPQPPGGDNTIGQAQFGVHAAQKYEQMFWNVFKNGTVTIYHGAGTRQVEVGSFGLSDGNAEIYKKYIVDFVEAALG
jgi:hypothetical protein